MKKLKKALKWIGLIVLVLGLTGFILYLIYLRPFVQKMKVINTINFDKELTIITGGGGNSGIISSDSMVIVVDTKMDDAAQDLFDTVKKMAGSKPILIINTHYHPDHVGGNKLYKGATIVAGANYGKELWIKEAGEESLPTEWIATRRDIVISDDTVSIINYGNNAHTESDVFVYLHRRKLLFGGDVVLNKQHPIIMGKGNPNGYLEAFAFLQKELDIQFVVPGHGDIGGAEVLNNYITYFEDMKRASQNDSEKESLLSKYNNWSGIPFVMSGKATIKAFH